MERRRRHPGAAQGAAGGSRGQHGHRGSACACWRAFIDSCRSLIRSSMGVRCSVLASLMRSGASPTEILATTCRVGRGAARAIAVAARVCWWGWGWGGGGEGGQTGRRVAFEGRSRGGRRCRRSAEMQEMQRCRSNGEVGARATCFSASALCVLLKQTA